MVFNLHGFQVRAFADTALQTLLKSGASRDGPPASHRDLAGETKSASDALLTLLPQQLRAPYSLKPNGPHMPRHPLLARSLDFSASLVADLIYYNKLGDAPAWKRCVGVYTRLWLGEEDSLAYAETVREHFLAADRVIRLSP
jgi:elongation factor 3